MQHYVTQLGEVLGCGREFELETDVDAATGSWRKSAVELAEQTYGFLFRREEQLFLFARF